MASVTNLAIQYQSGSSNLFFAKWDFDETFRSTTSSTTKTTGSVAVGKWVKIKPGSTYYNGVAIPSWVMSDTWKIIELIGNRAVIHQNKSGTHAIMSPINVNNLVGETTSSTTTSPVVVYNTLDHYVVEWFYYTGDGIWFSGGSSNIKTKYSTYNPPENARQIKITVKPVSKTRKVNGKDTAYWSGTSVTKTYNISSAPPEKPSAPLVDIKKYVLTASLENVSDPRTDQLEFQVVNGTTVFKTGTATVLTCRATFTCQVTAGGDYRVRCRAINLVGSSKLYSDWSDFSSSISAIPSAVSGITVCRASSTTSVYLEWAKVNTATGYEIEYTTEKKYFDGSDKVSSVTGIEFPHYEKTGLQSGQEYFFRVRAVNERGASAWSGIKSVIIGKAPVAPTTWSSTTTAITGNPVTLYWVHNAEDGSSETYAQIELDINGSKQTKTIQNKASEDELDKTKAYVLETSAYTEGTNIKWRVRTAGITKTYGEWSVQRNIDVYAPPTLEMNLTDANGDTLEILESFPFYLSALAGPNTQTPIGYHVSITSDEVYETIDNVGNPKMVNNGEQVYAKYFDISDSLEIEFSANNVDLENNVNYTVTCIVSMNSGLTVEESIPFNVSWSDLKYEPDAEIAVDTETYSAYIRPYCIDNEGNPIEDVVLSVYRREFDGTFTELASNIDVLSNTSVTDPHPALDYARYRIVATSKQTGAVSYYDAPGYPVNGICIILQWEEEWSNFDANGEDELGQSPWSGSMLKLPYNIDISDTNNADVDLIEYIGRSHPVTYYGTQLSASSTWNVTIEKSDKERLYALRRLSMWMGDVYVREPSGSGYWAHVSVSFSQKHCDLTIPVTLEVKRVEGGI